MKDVHDGPGREEVSSLKSCSSRHSQAPIRPPVVEVGVIAWLGLLRSIKYIAELVVWDAKR